MSKFKNYFNRVTNDGRIFSFEDVINIPQEEAYFYQEALDYQYGKIGFPKEKELRKSIDVSEVAPYTYSDGSVTRAHFRSNSGEQFIDSKKTYMTTPSMEKKRINEFIDKTSKKKVMNIDKANNKSQESPTFEIGIEYNDKPKTYRWETNKGACDKCKELDNKEFESKEDIPQKPHPNCKCEVEIVEKQNSKLTTNIKEFLKDLAYSITQTQEFKDLQDTFPENPLLNKRDLSAREYYQISLTGGNSINTIDTANIKTTVGQLKDAKLRNYIFNLPDVNADNNTMVVIPKQGARIINQIKKSKEFKKVINELLKTNSIKIGNNSKVTRLDYISRNPFKYGKLASDLALTIGHSYIYNTHFDEEGNLYTTLVDWYDFDEFQKKDVFNGINNNAYEQQIRGDLTNYVLVIPIVLTKTEVDNL